MRLPGKRGPLAVVLGGAGEVGAAVTEDLAGCEELDEIVCADLDRGKAEALAARLGPRVRAEALDLGDRGRALALLREAGLLVNCTSFALFDRVFELAVEAGVDYADLISEPTAEQRHRAERAGITAVSGLGITPGLSNVLVRDAAGALDEPEEVHVSWVSWRAIAPSAGLLDTILWELSDACPTRQYFLNGRFVRAGAMEGSRTVEFAPPVGRHRVYFMPHTETATLPRHFPTLRFCAVRGSWRDEIMEDVRVLNRYGLLEGPVAEAVKERVWEVHGGRRAPFPSLIFLDVEVLGRRDGETVRRVYGVSHTLDWGPEGTGRITGVCAGVGAQLLARHGRTRAGFVDPEEYYDPAEFLEELARRGTVTVACEESVVEAAALERTTT